VSGDLFHDRRARHVEMLAKLGLTSQDMAEIKAFAERSAAEGVRDRPPYPRLTTLSKPIVVSVTPPDQAFNIVGVLLGTWAGLAVLYDYMQTPDRLAWEAAHDIWDTQHKPPGIYESPDQR
jgi:hypothetical protein